MASGRTIPRSSLYSIVGVQTKQRERHTDAMASTIIPFLLALLFCFYPQASRSDLPPIDSTLPELKADGKFLLLVEEQPIFGAVASDDSLDDFLLLQQSHDNAQSSIISVLDENGLPVGLLPASVQSFSVSDDGQFQVHLDSACYAKFDYEVYYAQTITGKVAYGNISELSGIQAKELFFWVPVTGIRVDIPSSGYIYFEVGPISKRLDLSQFEAIPDCKNSAVDSRSLSRALRS